MAKLINNRFRTEYYIVTDPASIGRHKTNDIVLPGALISRFHAKLGTAEGQYYIQDLGSTYGTFVNRRRIDCQRDGLVALKDGDRILIGVKADCPQGEYDLTFNKEEVPAEAAEMILETIAQRETTESAQIKLAQASGGLVVYLSGTFTGPECDAMANNVIAQVQSRPQNVVLHLADVKYLNSYSLGTFIKLRSDLEELGQGFSFAAARGHVLQLLEMVGLTGMIGVYPTLEEALAALQK